MSKDIDITDELISREETSGYSFEKSEDLKENYIHKSVIREKIEELKDNLNAVEHYETVVAIQILQELLKEKGDEDK